jgi:hypothetical protein
VGSIGAADHLFGNGLELALAGWMELSPRQEPVTSSRYLRQNSHSRAGVRPIEAQRHEGQMPSSGHACAILSDRHSSEGALCGGKLVGALHFGDDAVADKNCGGVLRGACTDVRPTSSDSDPRIYPACIAMHARELRDTFSDVYFFWREI